mgnify:CR=1 FL=1
MLVVQAAFDISSGVDAGGSVTLEVDLVGRPVAVEGRRPDELMHELESWIEAEMRRIDPQGYT